MYRNLCVALSLVFGAFGLMAARSVGVSDSLPATPQIIRKVTLTNQTAPISTTILFTPSHNGIYRLHCYLAQTFQVNTYWFATASWSDDIGPQNTIMSAYSPINEVFIEAVAGQAVSYSVSANGSPGPYSLYITVERL